MSGTYITEQGDAALRVQFTSGDSDTRWRTVRRFVTQLETLNLPAIHGVAGTYDSVLVEFDSLRISAEDLRAVLRYTVATTSVTESTPAREPRRFRIPVCYGGAEGPDLELVAAQFQTSGRTLIEMHASHWFLIRAYGAPAASPMMDGLGAGISVPRRGSPRVRVPSGSIALAGSQSIIYSVPAPGGWQLIGRTPTRLVSAGSDEVCAYGAGDYLGYYPITRDEWPAHEGRALESFSV